MDEAEDQQRKAERVDTLFRQEVRKQSSAIDRMFLMLMVLQWAFGIVVAIFVSPYTWIGENSAVHVHVWAAVVLGGVLSSAPVFMAHFYPGRAITRHVIAIAQALWSALLIHLFGGRIETHFHIFGSLAFISLYRDWKVIVSMSLVVAADHAARGFFWPLSVYGVSLESDWRWLEHAAWVGFEDLVLVSACFRSRKQLRELCRSQAALEDTNERIEEKVRERSSELQDAKLFFQAVLDSMQSHICVLNKTGEIVATNAKWDEFSLENGGEGVGTGSNYIEACRTAKGDCTHGARSVANAIEAVIAGYESSYTAEYDCHSPTKQNWFQVNITPLENHTAGAAVVAHTDVSERVHAQNRLKETSRELELLSLVAKYTDNAVVITDPKGRIEWVNEGFERLTGYSHQEVFGRVPGSFLQGKDTDVETVDYMRKCLDEQKGFDVELVNYTRSGKPYWLSIEVRPIFDREGQIEKFIAIESDISERKNAENEKEILNQELRVAARQAGMAEVATGVLHNVGNVMNSLNVSAQTLAVLLEETPVSRLEKASQIISDNRRDLVHFLTDDPRGKLLPDMLEQFSSRLSQDHEAEVSEIHAVLDCLEHIQQIINKQQEVARTNKDILEPLSIASVLQDTLRLTSASQVSGQAKPEITVDCVDIPECVTDKHKLLQILVNLVQNAIQAVSDLTEAEHPSVNLNVSATPDEIEINVSDNGVGIAQEDLTTIFGHGFTTKDEGHGFGLHSSALDAKSLGGSLSAESDGPGTGATFCLRIPIENAKSEETPIPTCTS